MALSVLSQIIEASELSATVVTGIVQNDTTGEYIREFRFYGPAPDAGGEGPLLLTVRARSQLRDGVQYQSDALTL